ncbi:NUDIX hydrolase [Paludibaculum fermentans]|uniref:NUDIX hydrolase n=1 Tax=Paludibaculum fermentans TaxID=1473598 RepID=A0A7S7NSB9_PALFE|nr:NUDIX hydrolase [Paludibaculum fermentans]QOY88923.1 NUDIX hydrolase [Paludibaculum fermentans]
MDDPQWLSWVRQLQAIAQTGLTYAKDVYDIERYQTLRRLSAEMAAAGAGLPDSASILDLFSGDTGYATPKVDVRAAVFQAGRILLVQEHEDGLWTLPGGWADVGDAPSQAAVREVKEESGYDVVATKLAAVYDRNLHGHPPIPFHAYKLYFLCDLVGGQPTTSYETDAVEFFAEDQIPPLSLTRVTPALIAHLFEHHRHPEWPTSFD